MQSSIIPVITGVGVVSPWGTGREIFFEGLKQARSAVRTISFFNTDNFKCRVAGEVPDFHPEKYLPPDEVRRVPRLVSLGIAASQEAFEDAGVEVKNLSLEQQRQTAVVLGTGAGGIDFAESQYEHFFRGDLRKATPYAISSSFVGMLSSEISIYFGLRGQSHVISTGCTSSSDAIGYAANLLREGKVERVLTGGIEACITPAILAGFERMKVVSMAFNETPARASRPFNLDRDGFVLSEGAWVFLMESEQSAKKRKAKIYGAVTGYGSTCDAYHRVRMEPTGEEPSRAMQLAMDEACLRAEKIDYVNLHGTSTEMNDVTETLALKRVFGNHSKDVWTSATKSMAGHPQGACGALGVAATLYALTHQEIPPTINYENPDPRCDLNYTPNKPVRRAVQNALVNCLAFGSKNSALVLERRDML